MLFPDIWQTIGTPQVAEITAVISTAISIALAQRGQEQQPIKKISSEKCDIVYSYPFS